MRTHCRLLFLLSALAVGLCAKDEDPAPAKTADPARDLVWPEITNAKALIELAKKEISEVDTDGGIHGKKWGTTKDPLLDYLKPYETLVGDDFIMILLDTHPLTGQALVIAPRPGVLAEKYPEMFAQIRDTAFPEIKRVLIKLGPDSFKSLAGIDGYARWKNLTNETSERASCPYPTKIFAPGCPMDMSRAGIVGEAKVTFTVSEAGEVSDVVVKATHAEFAGPAEEAIKLWKFEPGVDLETRLPVATRVSVTAVYTPADAYYAY